MNPTIQQNKPNPVFQFDFKQAKIILWITVEQMCELLHGMEVEW